MVNYAWAFSQSESGKYFEWIIMITIIATIELWRHLVLGCQVETPSLVLVIKVSVLSPSCFVDYFNPVSSIHSYYTRQSQNDNLFVKSVHTTQYGFVLSVNIYSTCKLWNSLSRSIDQMLRKSSRFPFYDWWL